MTVRAFAFATATKAEVIMKSEQSARSASKRDYWHHFMNEWERSECRTQAAAFCRQAGIFIKSFRRWRSVFARESLQNQPKVDFAKVETPHPIGSGIRIALSAQPHIDIAPDFDKANPSLIAVTYTLQHSITEKLQPENRNSGRIQTSKGGRVRLESILHG